MSDNASLIITTSTYEKKFTSSRKKLFLGKWCFDSFFITKDKNVLDYHWDDRSKLFNDFNELELLYEEYLLIVSTELNSIHKTNYNKKFWRIFIGPWLKEIISILYDRYTNIKNLKNISSNTKIKYYQLKINNELFIPNNFEEAHSYYLHDNWNEYIYNLLLNKLDIKNLIKINSNVTFKNYPRKNKIKNNYINFIIKKFFYIYNFLINKNKKLFYLEQLGENINLLFLFKLSIWFKQIPTIWFRKKINFKNENFYSQRKWIIQNIDKNNNTFKSLLNEIIPLTIPRIYLENFLKIEKKIKFKDWPKNPKYIFTSNAFHYDDIFKYWCAKKNINGSKIIIGQHGGHYGLGLFCSSQKHELSISDHYFSWGWENDGYNNIIPIGNFLNFNKKIKYNKNGGLLIISNVFSKYFYRCFSMPIGHQYLSYLKFISGFINKINIKIKKNLFIRLTNRDFDWDLTNYWKTNHPDINFDNHSIKFLNTVKNYRLFVSTFNTTSFLETLKLNLPTIIILDKNYWELNEESNKHINKLKEIGVFFDNYNEASNFINNNWNRIEQWWWSSKVQICVKEFCNLYSCRDYDVENNFKKFFKI